jgi:ABC-type oligopeptide transport system substrate-binding subunit
MEKRVALRRDPNYFGDWSGNLDGIDLEVGLDEMQWPRDMITGRFDILETRQEVPREIPSEWQAPIRQPITMFMALATTRPPLDDIRVRRALMLGLDLQRFVQIVTHPGARAARGGLVPPGLPGHTPDMGIAYDLPAAQALLAQAGYPNGEGLAPLRGWATELVLANATELARMWKQALGIDVIFDTVVGSQPGRFQEYYHLVLLGWTADFPDPANFLQDSSVPLALKRVGWQDARYDALVEQAAHATNRAQRMAMYREADRILVAEQALLLPVGYGQTVMTLIVQPWIENAKMTLLGVRAREVVKRGRQ